MADIFDLICHILLSNSDLVAQHRRAITFAKNISGPDLEYLPVIAAHADVHCGTNEANLHIWQVREIVYNV